MDRTLKKILTGLILLLFMAALYGCQSSSSSSSGGGDNDDGDDTTYSDPTAAAGSDALTLSSQISVVDPKEDTDLTSSVAPGTGSIRLNGSMVAGAISHAINVDGFAAGSDYKQDQIDVWVHEESVQAFSTVNEILCSIDQTRYAEMKGEGNYRAQIDTDACSSDRDDASSNAQSSQNQSSSSNATSYEEWVVNSSREENQPHIVKVWISQEAEDAYDADKMIMAKMEIYQSATDDNPFGYFKLNFIGYPVDSDGEAVTTEDPYFQGYMKTVIDNDTGETLLQFVNSGQFGPSESFTEQATLRRSSSGTGAGTLSAPVWGDGDSPTVTTFNIAYNGDYFKRQKASDTAKCFNRNSFDKTVWNYSMYDSTGSRVQLDSGFPIKYGDYYGWVGYYGLWLPEEANISNGDTVYKQNYNDGSPTEEAYTVFIAGGRLIKHTKQTMELGELKNVPLQWYDDENGKEYRVIWNGSNLVKKAELDQDNWIWTEITETTLSFDSNDWAFHFWSEALGGSGSFNLKDNDTGDYKAPSSSTQVNFHVQDMVYPSDLASTKTLLCFESCPDATKMSNTSASSLTKSNKAWQENSTLPSAFTYHEYSFDPSDMVLRDSGTAVVMDEANEYFSWGFHSGILFEGTTENYNALKCNWDTSSTCNYEGWEELSTYYTWETGPENWNKFTALKSGSTFQKFDPPMKVTYVHSQSDSDAYDAKYDGVKFQLDYSGFGNLHGIPGHCIDSETGEATACDGDVRWVPEFNILPGSTVTALSDGTTEYVVKPLHVEQRMSEATDSNCADLTLTSYDLPAISDWTDPAIGDRPSVTSAPAVIAGEVQ